MVSSADKKLRHYNKYTNKQNEIGSKVGFLPAIPPVPPVHASTPLMKSSLCIS